MADSQPIPQPFGIIPTGSPLLITPTSIPTPTSYIYEIPLPPPPRKPFSHITVFLLPGITLPSNTAAAVYLSLPSPSGSPTFRFLGAVGEGKESAVFKISGLSGGPEEREIDMDAPEDGNPFPAGEITLGISIEPADAVAAQMAGLQQNGNGMSGALVLARGNGKGPDTLVLAQRIIKNAFNFLASFSGNLDGGVEVVPLKAFEEWWRKFEGRVRSDPGFLERGDGD